jgi:quercetin dioxygenase-like cupin family protein
MNVIRSSMSVVVLCSGLAGAHFAFSQRAASDAHGGANERARILLSKSLSKLDGEHLKAMLVEVRYGPGEASPPHSHPCAVVGYVVQGAIRSQVNGAPEAVYTAGDSFYEPPNGIHLVSANASRTEPAKLVAYLICDHETPISIDVPESKAKIGGTGR